MTSSDIDIVYSHRGELLYERENKTLRNVVQDRVFQRVWELVWDRSDILQRVDFQPL